MPPPATPPAPMVGAINTQQADALVYLGLVLSIALLFPSSLRSAAAPSVAPSSAASWRLSATVMKRVRASEEEEEEESQCFFLLLQRTQRASSSTSDGLSAAARQIIVGVVMLLLLLAASSDRAPTADPSSSLAAFFICVVVPAAPSADPFDILAGSLLPSPFDTTSMMPSMILPPTSSIIGGPGGGRRAIGRPSSQQQQLRTGGCCIRRVVFSRLCLSFTVDCATVVLRVFITCVYFFLLTFYRARGCCYRQTSPRRGTPTS